MSHLFSLFWSPEGASQDKETPQDDHKNADVEHIAEKAKKSGYSVVIRLLVTGDDRSLVLSEIEHLKAAFGQFASPGYNRFKASKYIESGSFFQKFVLRFPQSSLFSPAIFSLEEIASLYHFPHSKYNRVHEIKWQRFKIVGAPPDMPKEGILLGHNEYRGTRREIRLKREDRFRHFYVIGQTGTGKTSILQSMARQDIRAGEGLAVMDPHGDFANDLLPFIPKERAEDVIYFNPADLERPMGLNMLEYSGEDDKQMVVQDALSIMIRLFGAEIFGPRIQDYFRNGAITLMDYPEGGAITDIVRLFTDDNFQMARRQTVKDPAVKQWWQGVYSKQGDREKAEIIPYFQAKFGGFITNRMMRNIIGQTTSSFDVYDTMQSGKILLINLSKGLLGDFNSNLLGLILVSKMQIAAMRRQSIAKEDRRDFFLYIDEFQNYVTESIESILSEARKYRLSLNVAHQYIAQLQKSDSLTKSNLNLKDAIFGNVGTIMSYRISSDDGEAISEIMKPNFSDFDLVNMDKFRAVIRPLVDSQPTPSFSIIPLNPYLEE